MVENNKYNHNIEIMNKLTISQANIIKYIKLTNNNSIIEATKKILELNPNMLVKDFIKNFLHLEFDKTCKYFLKFYKQLYEGIELKTLKTYYGKFI